MTISKPKVIEKWQKKNKYGRPGTPIKAKKVIIHYTGKAEVPGKNTVKYFNETIANGHLVNGKYVYASAHYVIDLDGTIYQLIPTDEKAYASNEANSYAVSIEVATTGKDNHYTDATYKSMVHLCAWLCEYKKLDCKKDILTHTDIVGRSYKECPVYMVFNPKKMTQFKLDSYNLKAGKIAIKDIKNCTNGKGEVTKIPGTSTTTPSKEETWKNGDYNCKVKTTANVNLREGRGTDFKIIKTIPKGTVLTIGYVNNNWGSTWDFGKCGYLSCKYIKKL
ncbi:N-acetylmuramoyl-L-alanine amidase [Clostridium perfringens]|uniref:N-acetylmuramoyl-L-alanine amidase n=1 Tax=Clostridium perfringens TaxID=1502 RepID=UPI002330CD44|nr:N-acetylmuramoyl-L-alanine amidase [Clostridium perfringens]MDB2049350.1 N-acetylmuramoyl-L-alanine amidase [Clostridium perfringens]